jgi:hypothetical protein
VLTLDSGHSTPEDGAQEAIEQVVGFLISNFRLVLNVVCLLLGYSLASDVYMPTFQNTLSVPSSQVDRYSSYPPTYEDGRESVPKRRHIKFRCWGITQKKAYNKWLDVSGKEIISCP